MFYWTVKWKISSFIFEGLKSHGDCDASHISFEYLKCTAIPEALNNHKIRPWALPYLPLEKSSLLPKSGGRIATVSEKKRK